jgi:streptogramin lyase
LSISLSFICNFFSFCQSFYTKSFSTRDGLAHNNVRVITQDKSGYIWIGTFDGISRYDGYDFRNYYHVPGDTASLDYFSIYNICVDGANNLWILSDIGNISLYHRNDETFEHIKNAEGYLLSDLRSIGLDEEENLIIVSQDKIFRRYYNTGLWMKYNIKDKFGNSLDLPLEIIDISYADRSEIWITGINIYQFILNDSSSAENNSASLQNQFNLNSSSDYFSINFNFTVRHELYHSPEGNIWIFSNNGLYKLNRNSGEFDEFTGVIPRNEFTVNKIYMWGWKMGDIDIYDPEKEQLMKLPGEETQFSKSYFCQDKKLFWYSNFDKYGIPSGIHQITRIPGFFKKIYIDKTNENFSVFSVYKDKADNVWIGTREKSFIPVLTSDGKIIKYNDLPPDLWRKAGPPKIFIEDSSGIWIGYYTQILIHIDPKTGDIIQHFPDAQFLHTILPDEEGNLYIGTDKLLKYDPLTKKTEVVWSPSETENFYKLVKDSNQKIWAGLSNCSLLFFDPDLKITKQYLVCNAPYNIEDICFSDNGELWLALLGGGICRFNPSTGKSEFFTTVNGLSNNTTYCIIKDRNSNIWVSTNNGISMLNHETGSIRTFGLTEGLDITEFNSDASFHAKNGEVFFGGMGGLVHFYPDSLLSYYQDQEPAPFVINELSVSGVVRHLKKPINEIDTIILQRGENNFHLTFSTIDFISSEKTKYRYRLHKIDDDWIETDSKNRNINYSNLKLGFYKLVIEATNQLGDWTSSKEITIKISPFFYQTFWFILLLFLIFNISLVSIIWLYIRQIKAREKQKQDELRLESLRGQMNPHFIFNSLNSINYFISKNDRLSANRYISDFAKLIRSILSNIKSNYIPLENEIESIESYLKIEYLRFGDKFDYSIEIKDDIDLSIEVLPGLIQPFVENSIWHGIRSLETRKGIIKIRLYLEFKEKLKCVIEDDGVGFKFSTANNFWNSNHKSRGIQIVRERLNIIGKSRNTNYAIDILDLFPDRSQTGTRVIVDIPYRNPNKIRND